MSKVMHKQIRFIFFDVGNTLLFPNRERIHAPLAERGILAEKEHLRDLECRTKNQFDGLLARSGSIDRSFWWMYYTQLLTELRVHDEILRDQLVTNIRQSGNWDQIRAGTFEQLHDIAGGFEIAVISNADGSIEKVLERCGIARCFRTITDSGLVGVEKPHPEIFVQALESMNAPAAESLYVGDVYSVDYLGATGAGMQAILMDVCGAYREKGVARVESLEELKKALARESKS
jgi:HAD superfamily hydrolase (TIGR01549 family)